MAKLVIREKDIRQIKDAAFDIYQRRYGFGSLSQAEIQTLLITEALIQFARGQGVELPLEVDFDPYKKHQRIPR